MSISRSISSAQTEIHKDLQKQVERHLEHEFRKPIAAHTERAYEKIMDKVSQDPRPVIFDACCGVGESSRQLAENAVDKLVIGVDKSDFRLNKNYPNRKDNLLLIRADLNDLYRLFARDKVLFSQHKILYPNPWPKISHLKRRWHGSAVFPQLVALSKDLELRSNWLIYLQEFQAALKILGHESYIKQLSIETPLTPFEAKYHNSGQPLFQLVSQLV
ncbi:tRNA (guanine(46)-N(7))-methyltransferase TrmB [Gayadomonas joobiniege]|uniref:tRNA (guanine(46)-N(7))-methyltransferase TrmB n=1 Tax=Gayadomonas joobiniege TaxID=1234606 RepID=UPI00037F4E15|nr:hypothetical protein [Gayadomonas joobiniege]